MSNLTQTIAVAYLARGANRNWLSSCERFLESYKNNDPGAKHSLYVILKGFENDADLEKAKVLFSSVPYTPVLLGDDNLDIGAYIEWANIIKEDVICAFNTESEILASNWLRKLAINLALPNVGLVGATASYESMHDSDSAFAPFPNIHVRPTAFMIDRRLFVDITEGLNIVSKEDAYHFESGPKGLSQQVLDKGHDILLVGRNGRGYSPKFWATSDTFRQGPQKNLLVADNQTRNFSALPWGDKRAFVIRTWGKYIMDDQW